MVTKSVEESEKNPKQEGIKDMNWLSFALAPSEKEQ